MQEQTWFWVGFPLSLILKNIYIFSFQIYFDFARIGVSLVLNIPGFGAHLVNAFEGKCMWQLTLRFPKDETLSQGECWLWHLNVFLCNL